MRAEEAEGLRRLRGFEGFEGFEVVEGALGVEEQKLYDRAKTCTRILI